MEFPTSPFSSPIHTDYYQITMAYAYWKNGKQNDPAVFDLFFRKNPFHGEYTIFCGLSECLRLVESFKIPEDFLEYLMKINPHFEPEFIDYLRKLDCSEVTVRAIEEGTVVFPNTPLIEVSGPVGVCQLLETPFLNLINYPTLIATNAARLRKAAGDNCKLMEFGLRRAQGPNGALSASRYAVAGGFDSTSNTLAGMMFNIPIAGTHAHSFVQSYRDVSDLKNTKVKVASPAPEGYKENEEVDFLELVEEHKKILSKSEEFKNSILQANSGEYAAFIAYALSFPMEFCALVDSYHTIRSGVINYICVASALCRIGYSPLGIRLDSGDLSYLSNKCRELIDKASEFLVQQSDPKIKKYYEKLAKSNIVASNDLSEPTILALNQQGHSITIFGIGTNLVTCLETPALGGVYKLVEINGSPRMKIAQDVAISKMPVPGRKELIRCFNEKEAIIDIIVSPEDIEKGIIPIGDNTEQKSILAFSIENPMVRSYVIPKKTVPLLVTCWDKGKMLHGSNVSVFDIQKKVKESLATIREDTLRSKNAVQYRVSLSEHVRVCMTKLIEKEMPIGRIE